MFGSDPYSHLPAGFEPGAQSVRNNTRTPFWEWMMRIVGGGSTVTVHTPVVVDVPSVTL